jgi:hypothetical protein
MCESDYRRTIRMGINGYRNATKARQHVAALRELGWAYEQIADEAGLSTWVPHNLHLGRTARLLPESERAILALPLKPHASQRGVDSAGTRRRVQALAWMGWPASEVACRAGTTASSLQTLILPRRQISYALAQRVAAVYDDLAGTEGPSRMAALKARQLRHAPPAAWDDDTIDDPNSRPQGIRRPTREQQRAARAGLPTTKEHTQWPASSTSQTSTAATTNSRSSATNLSAPSPNAPAVPATGA